MDIQEAAFKWRICFDFAIKSADDQSRNSALFKANVDILTHLNIQLFLLVNHFPFLIKFNNFFSQLLFPYSKRLFVLYPTAI